MTGPHPYRTPRDRVFVRVLHLWDATGGGPSVLPFARVQGVSADDDEYVLPGVQFLGVCARYQDQPAGVLVALLRAPVAAVAVLAAQRRVLLHDHDVMVPVRDPGPGDDPGAVRWFNGGGVQQYGPSTSDYADVDVFVAGLRVRVGAGPVVDRGLSFPG